MAGLSPRRRTSFADADPNSTPVREIKEHEEAPEALQTGVVNVLGVHRGSGPEQISTILYTSYLPMRRVR
jgi:hypothetical protein